MITVSGYGGQENVLMKGKSFVGLVLYGTGVRVGIPEMQQRYQGVNDTWLVRTPEKTPPNSSS
jgi:hypothetical protein